jgi:hypothetical protein
MQMAVRAGVNGLMGLGTTPAGKSGNGDIPTPMTDLREPEVAVASATSGAFAGQIISKAKTPAWALGAIGKWKACESQIEGTVSALSKAAEVPVPDPAEKAGARVAVIVLKPKDAGAQGGFAPSALASAVQRAAKSSLGGHLAGQDQFAYAGHRYRTFYVDASRSRVDNMVRRLEPFESKPDDSVVKAITDQNSGAGEARVSVSQKPGDGMVFFTSAENDLTHAIEEMPNTNENPAPSNRYRVQFVVVE